jgi:hemerythrin
MPIIFPGDDRMPLCAWTPKYSVKVKRFDEDHQHLFNILNQLNDGMQAGRGHSVLENVLMQLLRYSEWHFTAEEAVLRELHYPQLRAHTEQHRKFTAKMEDVAERYQTGSVGLSVEVLNFLKNWLSQHIDAEDKKYGPFLNSQGVS